ncbi:hypothetical protein VMT65_25665 [Nocardia sp. CDC153]|uniref:hypothetical protein n=1 Tax=Nocardia sp. CDC153 TaxID=3112167 RepID=UPI002DB5F36D|nr:hypothetical protein [Nocardia sp. CDC153]MEC3956447.1 hypothetical protein [Nocardia sp. CDC153]
MRSRQLRDRFGPEYDRAVQESPDRKTAEQELTEREKRHDQLQLRELSDEEKRRYEATWSRIQEQFIDDPAGALDSADRLVTQAMTDRGYPSQSYDQQLADLSVEHARPLGQFRTAHDIAARAERGSVSTEDMRTAIVHYRELFADLVDGGNSGSHRTHH